MECARWCSGAVLIREFEQVNEVERRHYLAHSEFRVRGEDRLEIHV